MLLERCVLAQPNSRYEVSGEYMMPPGVEAPWGTVNINTPAAVTSSTNSSQAAAPGSQERANRQQPQQGEGQAPEEGRWRVQVGGLGG